MSSSLKFYENRSLWWREEADDDAAKSMVETFSFLDGEQAHHRDRNLHHLRLYSNRMAASFSGASFADFYPWEDERLRVNIVQAVIDAAVSQLATSRPRAMPLTIDGEWELENRAKYMGRYIDGLFHSVQQYELGLQIFQDGVTYGTGIEKVLNECGDVGAERVHPDELVVDDIEARNGKPRTFYQYKETSAELALAMFGEHVKGREEIIEKARLLRDDHVGRRRVAEPISLIESFHLPSSRKAKDGKHIIATSEGPILVEAWNRRSPYAVFRWKHPGIGFWGTGIAEEVASIQIEINYILEKIQRLLWMAAPQTWVHKGTVSDTQWTNEEFAVREFAGSQPPIFNNPSAVSPEYFNQVQTLIDRAFQITGISQLYAASQKPSGLNSGEAIKNYNDIQSARFLHVGQRYEQFHMDVAELVFEEARALEKGGHTIVAKGQGSGLEELKFSEVNIERDKYQLRVFPTAFLPSTPAGKMDTLEQFGKISPEIQKHLLAELQFPDLEKALSVVNAPLELTDMVIDQILHKGKAFAVEPMWPHELMRDRATLMAARAQVKNAPEARVDALRKFASDCQKGIDDKAAAIKAAAMAQPAAPMTPEMPAAPMPGAPMAPMDAAQPAAAAAPLPMQ